MRTIRDQYALRTLLGTVTILIALAGSACQTPTPDAVDVATAETGLVLPEGSATAAERINADSLSEYIGRLASDEFEGRGPAAPGDQLARQYLAETMATMGLEPAFDGEWEQPVELVSVTAKIPDSWDFQTADQTLSLKFWDDFIAGSGVQNPATTIEDSEVVFVGYGIQAPEYDWDDFKGQDLEGKVLLMLNNDPDWDKSIFAGETRLYYGRWDYKYESAAAQGAAGAIIIHTTPSAGYPFQVVQTSWTGPQFELPAGDEARIQVKTWVTEDSAKALVELAGQDLDQLLAAARSRDFEPVPLGVTTSLDLTNDIESVKSANVGGLLQGSDTELENEVVVYTAHHDHLGIGEPNETGDNIYNGAKDNATGCAVVLALADAITSLPEAPRRSSLFLFVAAEEQGLLGSQYYAQNPSYEPGRMAANINVDGANIWGKTSDITYIGYGKSSLDAVVDAAAARQGRVVKPDQFPDRGFFYRSDQFNLAKIGVPAIYLDNGTEFVGKPAGWGVEQIEAWEEIHYHQPSDELVDSWIFEGMVEDTRLIFEAGLHISNSDTMPSWNPGDEFEAARLEALAALE